MFENSLRQECFSQDSNQDNEILRRLQHFLRTRIKYTKVLYMQICVHLRSFLLIHTNFQNCTLWEIWQLCWQLCYNLFWTNLLGMKDFQWKYTFREIVSRSHYIGFFCETVDPAKVEFCFINHSWEAFMFTNNVERLLLFIFLGRHNKWWPQFLSDPGKPLWVRMSITPRRCWDLTDVTLADEDSNSIPTDNANRAIQGNLTMQVTRPGGQLWKQCKWRHLMTKFWTNARCATWWPIFKNIARGTTDP